ncbi:ATPase domain-containing protein [Methylocystis echinoides]|uniref:ATPase domain-containing protein n=1 Tax=Methylocystis echinoides TaxID=29468 RepID=UPI00342E9EAC
MNTKLQLSRLASSGVPGLDAVVLGGLKRRHIYLIEGMPGAGKTTLALQFLLEGARQKERCLYVTLSETERELRNTAQSHGWSLDGVTIFEVMPLEADPEQQQSMIYSSEVELDQTVSLIIQKVRELNPDRLVIDALTELRLLAQDALSYRRQVLALRRYFAQSRSTVLALDDLTDLKPGLQLHSIVHGVFNLEQRRLEYGATRRRLSIIKLRGANYRSGYHDFVIRTGGITVFPSLVAAEHETKFTPGAFSSQIAELDALLGGGLRRGTSTLLIGPSGVGKSSMALQFAVAASKKGQRVAIFAFDEAYRTASDRARGLGLDLDGARESGHLIWTRCSPTTISPGEFVDEAQRQVNAGVGMVIIDSLNSYMISMPEEQTLLLHMHELLAYLGNKGIVTILLLAQRGLVGSTEAPLDVSFLADTIVLMRYFEAEGEVRKAVSVLKSRSGRHETAIREYRLNSKQGVSVGPPIRDFQGVLTGVPTFIGSPGSLPHMPHDAS